MSIIAGIITTIYQFLKISELNEGHRSASISWGKFYNNLKTIVLRHPLDRLSQMKLLKFIKMNTIDFWKFHHQYYPRF